MCMNARMHACTRIHVLVIELQRHPWIKDNWSNNGNISPKWYITLLKVNQYHKNKQWELHFSTEMCALTTAKSWYIRNQCNMKYTYKVSNEACGYVCQFCCTLDTCNLSLKCHIEMSLDLMLCLPGSSTYQLLEYKSWDCHMIKMCRFIRLKHATAIYDFH